MTGVKEELTTRLTSACIESRKSRPMRIARRSAPRVLQISCLTEQHLMQVLEKIRSDRGSRGLEIGGHDDYAFRRPFRDAGCECYETIIYFVYDDEEAFIDWPVKVAGDMNELPYKDASFDIVFASATTHHSPDLEATIREMAVSPSRAGSSSILTSRSADCSSMRSIRPRRGPPTEDGIKTYTKMNIQFSYYQKLFRKYGLEIDSARYTAYYEEKLDEMETAGVRHGNVAKIVSRLMRFAPAKPLLGRYALYWGQASSACK